MVKTHTSQALADQLSWHMEEANLGDARLAKQVNHHFKQPHFLHRSTVRNWRTGTSKKVKDWRQLAAIATVLGLSRAQVNALLKSASLPTVQTLRQIVDVTDQRFLELWLGIRPDEALLREQVTRHIELVLERYQPTIRRQMLPIRFTVPLHQNPFFVGRQVEMQKLAQLLLSQPNNVVITGLGGVGKTQLAAEFAHQYRDQFPGGIFWLNFEKRETVAEQISALMEQEQGDWQATWQDSLARLLIFDGCENIDLLQEWRPVCGACRVLVTSRCGYWEPTINMVQLPLGVLAREDGVVLLQQFSADLEDMVAEQIAALLGDLPLALHLAGSFLRKYYREVSSSHYVKQLLQFQEKSLLMHPSLQGQGTRLSPTQHDLHVARTFALSYQELNPYDGCDALALKILERMTQFPPNESIDRCLLVGNGEASLDVVDAISRLASLGLLDMEVNGMVRIHALVAHFVRGRVAANLNGALPQSLPGKGMIGVN